MSKQTGLFGSRTVIKVGSALLVDDEGRFDPDAVARIGADCAGLAASGCELIVVSSGAVAIGCGDLQIRRDRAKLEDLQAAAAAGQVKLVQAWQDVLSRRDLGVAQVLLTPGDTEDRQRFLNARGTLTRLLRHRVVPIVNENDTVATDELRYGDNDRLAARVAQMMMADSLVLLSDVAGLYTGDPHRDTTATHVPFVQIIDDSITALAARTNSRFGSGGMSSKIEAARIATRAGCRTFVASGRAERPLSALGDESARTLFAPSQSPGAARKQWLGAFLRIAGQVEIDEGACEALAGGKSLLPVGVTAVNGEFERGDIVAIRSRSGIDVGRGIAAFGSEALTRIAGCQSSEIESRLGYKTRSVVVHRDDLMLFTNARDDR